MLSTSDMLVDALQSLDIGSTMTLAPGHSQSLVEFSEHDPRLVTSLISPLDPVLTQELVKATENVVPISTMLQPSTQVLATSPAPVHLLPIWKSFDLFVAHLVRNSNVSVAVIAFALIILDRLKEKLPVSTQEVYCIRYGIVLTALMIASKCLSGTPPRNSHWGYYADGIFNLQDLITTEMKLLGWLGSDLRVTEAELVARLAPLRLASSSTSTGTPGDRLSLWAVKLTMQQYFHIHPIQDNQVKSHHHHRRGPDSATDYVPVPSFMVDGQVDIKSNSTKK